MKRRYFSGSTLDQAVMQAARHHGLEPDELAYRQIEKRHGFLRSRKAVMISVDPDNPRREPETAPVEPPPAPAEPATAAPPATEIEPPIPETVKAEAPAPLEEPAEAPPEVQPASPETAAEPEDSWDPSPAEPQRTEEETAPQPAAAVPREADAQGETPMSKLSATFASLVVIALLPWGAAFAQALAGKERMTQGVVLDRPALGNGHVAFSRKCRSGFINVGIAKHRLQALTIGIFDAMHYGGRPDIHRVAHPDKVRAQVL